MISNCLFFALHRWWCRGGYVVIRKSRYGRWWWHFLWSKDLKWFESFVPVTPNHKRRFPPLLFRGYVKCGDE
jgi:hypothetical protein